MSQWADDEDLMSDLGEALADHPVPPHRRTAARAAFAWRTVDQELLALVRDSAELATAPVRGPDAPRVLSFEGAGLALEIELDDGQVMGQLLELSAPTTQWVITLETPDGEDASATADGSGFFVLPLPSSGPVRFVVTVDGRPRRTEWVLR